MANDDVSHFKGILSRKHVICLKEIVHFLSCVTDHVSFSLYPSLFTLCTAVLV